MRFGKRAVAWADLYGPFAAELLPGNVFSDAILFGIVAEREEKETFQRSQCMESVQEDASLSASERQRLRRESTCFDDGEDWWREVPSGLQTLRLLQASDDVTPVSNLL